MRPEKVKGAIIGCGTISEAYLSTITSKLKILDMVGCCDLDPIKAANTADKYKLRVMTLKEIIEDSSIEMVINLTTSPVHFKLNKSLLLAGKHVYTEKVMALTLEEANELVELSRSTGRYLGSAPDTFLGSALQTTRYIIDSGMIGEITSCYAVLTRDVELFASLAPFTSKKGGGIAFDVGIYYITALLQLLGPVKTVTGMMRTSDRIRKGKLMDTVGETFELECEDLMSGTMLFESGVVGNVLFDSNSVMIFPERPALTIHGTLGIVTIEDPNLFGGEVRVLLKGNNEPFVMQPTHPFSTEYRGLGAAEMAWAIRQGRVNRASKEAAYHALEVLHGMDISGETQSYYSIKSTFKRSEPIPRGFLTGMNLIDIETSALA